MSLAPIPVVRIVGDQTELLWDYLVLPISDSVVLGAIDPILNAPLNINSYINGAYNVGATTVNSLINTGFAEANYFLGGLPFAASTQESQLNKTAEVSTVPSIVKNALNGGANRWSTAKPLGRAGGRSVDRGSRDGPQRTQRDPRSHRAHRYQDDERGRRRKPSATRSSALKATCATPSRKPSTTSPALLGAGKPEQVGGRCDASLDECGEEHRRYREERREEGASRQPRTRAMRSRTDPLSDAAE